jgi:hypothetical protein
MERSEKDDVAVIGFGGGKVQSLGASGAGVAVGCM